MIRNLAQIFDAQNIYMRKKLRKGRKWRDRSSTDVTCVGKLPGLYWNKTESDGYILCLSCSVALLGFSAPRASNRSGCH